MFKIFASSVNNQPPIKSIDEVIEMIRKGESFKAAVNKDVYKWFACWNARPEGVRNMVLSYYKKGIYYDGRFRQLVSTNFIDHIVYDEISITLTGKV